MSEPLAEALLASALRQGRRVVLVARGRSMEPTIPEGSRVEIEPGGAPRPGEVVAVVRPDGGLALHRAVALTASGLALTWGDAMPRPDAWGPSAPLGRVSVLEPGAPRSPARRLLGALRARAHVLLGPLLTAG